MALPFEASKIVSADFFTFNNPQPKIGSGPLLFKLSSAVWQISPLSIELFINELFMSL